jgi:hypothetical protein
VAAAGDLPLALIRIPAFGRIRLGDLAGDSYISVGGDAERSGMFRHRFSIVFIIYIIIGLVVAWEKHYITVSLLKGLLSALLAILLWWLALLGVNLHIH